jgi:feruloyl-CoA synthase
VRKRLAAALSALAAGSAASSMCPARVLIAAEPLSIDAGEITDKGYINQRAVLTRRAGALATLDDDSSAEWIGCAG